MASLDFDQKFLGRIAKQTADSNPLLSASLYQILGLSVLLARRLIKARKLRKLDTSRDTPSLLTYQHILWLSREGLSILELYVLPYAQDNQHGPECRVLSVKLRASFYHIFCLFHNQPPVTSTNMTSTDSRTLGAPPLPLSERTGNGQHRTGEGANLSPASKRVGKQPTLREPIDSIVSETSFVTNPYAAGGPVGTPSPGPLIAPPGLHPIPLPQPSSFILPPLNFVPLAGGYFVTATAYATSCLPGSHPLRLSVALEHSAFLWDCLHDHEGSRRIARRAIKDVYRAQEAMDDTEFEDAAELVGILGRMMKRKSWEGTPRVPGLGTPEPPSSNASQAQVAQSRSQSRGQGPAAVTQVQTSPQSGRRAAGGPPITTSPTTKSTTRSRASSTSKPKHVSGERTESTPRVESQRRTGGSQDTTPRVRHASVESGASRTPQASQVAQSPATPSSTRSVHQQTPGGSSSRHRRTESEVTPTTRISGSGRSPATPSSARTPQRQPNTGLNKPLPPIASTSPLAAAIQATDNVRLSPALRKSPPTRQSPPQQSTHGRQR